MSDNETCLACNYSAKVKRTVRPENLPCTCKKETATLVDDVALAFQRCNELTRDLAATKAALDEAYAMIESLKRSHHVEDGDCWYSCPKSGKCCRYDDPADQDQPCDCGADKWNQRIDDFLRKYGVVIE